MLVWKLFVIKICTFESRCGKGLIHALGEFQSNSDFFFFLMKKKKFVEREDRNSLV